MARPINIYVNLPDHHAGRDHAHYEANRDESLDAFLARVTAAHPDWTDAVLIIQPK